MSTQKSKASNAEISSLLERVASMLEEQHANKYRIDAYRSTAEVAFTHDLRESTIRHRR